jgi:preprotein translocase subunit SecF
MIGLSLAVIIGGIAGTILRGGFYLGVDFQAGLNQRMQIAPIAFTINDNREDLLAAETVQVDVTSSLLSVSIEGQEQPRNYSFPFAQYTGYGELCAAIEEAIPGFQVTNSADILSSTSSLLAFSYPAHMTGAGVAVNYLDPAAPPLEIEDIREALSALGNIQIQTVGDPANREFNVRVLDSGEDPDFAVTISGQVVSLLEARYGRGQALMRSSEYVGPRFSGELAKSATYMILLTLILILIYIWFRFKLAYAVSAIIALAHDTVILLGFIGLTQMEVVSSTIAAVLTIIGYSLNDTIVVFDRIRENRIVMKDADFRTIIDSSITQSLSRTIITSLTTLLSALALYIFTQGAVKSFALALIVGIVVGTYSSIFVAAPILLSWSNFQRRRHKGDKAPKKPANFEPSAPGTPELAAPERPALTLVREEEIPKLERRLKKKKKKR